MLFPLFHLLFSRKSFRFLVVGAREALRPPLTLPTGRVPVPRTRSASNAAHLVLRLRYSGGSAGFRRAQNTAPSGRSRPFWGARGHSFRLFLQEEGELAVRPLPGWLVGLLVWRPLIGLGSLSERSWPVAAGSFSWVTHGQGLPCEGKAAAEHELRAARRA